MLSARTGFMPSLTRSEIFFLRTAIEDKAGLINKASLALKKVSSLFDSNAKRGTLIESEHKWSEVPFIFFECMIPFCDTLCFENIILPPRVIISDSVSETLETDPLS